MECFLIQKGGAALNFDVKAYATEELLKAATPKENTIGIVTTVPITSWIFSATEPEEKETGMVWFAAGTAGTIEFNALKKNAIQVFPLFANQYVDGNCVNVTAMIYKGGEWEELWDGYFFKNGVISRTVTGWTGHDNGGHIGFENITDGSVTFGDTIVATISTYRRLTFYPLPAVDLTPFSKYVVDVSYSHAGDSSYVNCITVADENFGVVASKTVSGTSRQTVEVDISAFSGLHLCGVKVDSVKGATTIATVYSMKLVK